MDSMNNSPNSTENDFDTFLDVIQRIGLSIDDYPSLHELIILCSKSKSIKKIDHLTFICPPEDREKFMSYWLDRGFSLHGIWKTERYPADHIALVHGQTPDYPWSDMVGLTVGSSHANSENRPLSLSVHPGAGNQLQHIAFNVNVNANFDALYQEMSNKWGLRFMTPVLSYHDDNGASLHQCFTRPVGSFFIEFIQRLPNRMGEPYGGFDPDIIDDLYEALDEHISIISLPPEVRVA